MIVFEILLQPKWSTSILFHDIINYTQKVNRRCLKIINNYTSRNAISLMSLTSSLPNINVYLDSQRAEQFHYYRFGVGGQVTQEKERFGFKIINRT